MKRRIALIGSPQHCDIIMQVVDILESDTDLIPIEPTHHGIEKLHGNHFNGYIILASCDDDRYKISLPYFTYALKSRIR